MPIKKGASPGIVVDKLRVPGSIVAPSAEEQVEHLENASRRNFIRRGSTIAGSAIAAGTVGASEAHAALLAIPPTSQEMGRPIPAAMYGMPSKFESHVA